MPDDSSGEFIIDRELAEPPDTSDVVAVIVNVETREGRQFSFGVTPQAGHTMSLSVDDLVDVSSTRGWLVRIVERKAD